MVIVAILYGLFTFLFAIRVRGKVFTQKFMESLGKEVEKDAESLVKEKGFPDMGNGYYGRRLKYLEWM